MAKKRDDFNDDDFIDDLEPVEPIDDDLEIVEPLDESDLIEPLDEDDLEVVEPIDEDDLEVVEPIDEDDLEVVEPIDDAEPVAPIAQPTQLAKTDAPKTQLSRNSPEPTKIAKPTPPPTKIAKPTPPSTKIAKKDAEPTKLAQGDDLDNLEPIEDVEPIDGDTMQLAKPTGKSPADDIEDLDQLVDEDLTIIESGETEEIGEQQPSIDDLDLAEGAVDPIDASELTSFESEDDKTEGESGIDLDSVDDSFDQEESAVDLGGEPASGSQISGVDPIADDIESGTDLKDAVEPMSDDDVADLLAGDPDLSKVDDIGEDDIVDIGADKADDVEEIEAIDDLEDPDLVEAEPDGEVAVKTKKRQKASPAGDDDDGGGRGSRGVRPPRSRWPSILIGMVAMLFLLGIALGLIWYLKPDLIDKAYAAIPESPNLDDTGKAKRKLATGSELAAMTMIDKMQYGQAIQQLSKSQTTTAKWLRGKARILKYLQDLDPKGAPDVKDSSVVLGLQELESGNQKALADQVRNAFGALQLKTAYDAAVINAKITTDIAKTLGLNDPSQAPQQIAALMKEQADLAGYKTEFQKAYPKSNLNIQAFKTLLASDSKLTSINTALQKIVGKVDIAGVKELYDRKAKVDALMTVMNKYLEKEVKKTGIEGVMQLALLRTQIETEKKKLDDAIGKALTELGQFNPKTKDDLKNLVDGVAAARNTSESPITLPLAHVFGAFGNVGKGVGQMMRKTIDLSSMSVEFAYHKALAKFVEKPIARLDRWVDLLSIHFHNDANDLKTAMNEASWIRKDSRDATAADKAKAAFVLGLVQRNQLTAKGFDEARKYLQAAVAEGTKLAPRPKWIPNAVAAIRELTGPEVYFIPLAMRKAGDGKPGEAIVVLDQGLVAFPTHTALILARAKVLFDANKGSKNSLMAAAAAIRKDAEAVQTDKSTSTKSKLLLGQLEEKLGNYAKAEKYYRAAKADPNRTAADETQANLALGRLLLQTPAADAEEANGPILPPTSKTTSPANTNVGQPQLYSLVSLVIAQVPNPKVDDKEQAKIQEAIELANDIIKKAHDDKTRGQGYMLLGRALFRKGLHNDGMKNFAKGMSMAFPGIGGKVLDEMLKNHPSLARPDFANRNNPTLAEKYFGQGLHLYWSKDYALAETQFEKAVRTYAKDARYLYFLGLSQLYQDSSAKRKIAQTNFQEGANLENQSLPTSEEISISLERVQGPIRQYIDKIRLGIPAN